MKQVLVKSQRIQKLTNLLKNPNIVDMVQNQAEFTEVPPDNPELTLEEIKNCQRPGGSERVWVLSQEEANQVISEFNDWVLAKKYNISAQTSYNSGSDVKQAALDESFGASGEYLDFYRKGDLSDEILETLPEIFSQIQTQELPDCTDPLQNPVENTSDHSRLMIGDVILIPCLVQDKLKLKTVHFIVGDDTKVYLKIRENLQETN